MPENSTNPRWFYPLLPGTVLRDRILACAAAAIGIGLTGAVTAAFLPIATLPWIVAPMGASAVLLFAVPASPLAQPWPMIGGNVLSALIGALVVQAIGTGAVAAGIAVGAAILAMSLLRCLHPPGGAAALTVVIGGPAVTDAGWTFAFAPVGLNSLLLLAVALAFHRFSGHSYPHRTPVQAGPRAFERQDVDAALADLGEALDIERGDLETLLERAEHHARERAARERTAPARRVNR